MPDTTHKPLFELDSIPDKDKYLLDSRDEVVMSLLELSKKPDLITAYYGHANDVIITTVVDVLQERNLVILECGPNSEKNRQLLSAGSTTCLSKHNDIDIRFQLNGLRSARYQGQSVFAAPIPETLLRLQRREFFRVHTPLMTPITCHFEHQGSQLALPLADISIGGLALVDAKKCFNAEQGIVLPQCTLCFPEQGGEIELALEVRGIFMYGQNEGKKVRRIGCAYLDLSPSDSHFIQRYINRLQIQQKNRARA